jgi:polar amino acid transport system substrate-binding protein
VVAAGRGWTAPAGRLCRDGNCAVAARTGTVSGYSVVRELRTLGYEPTLVTLDAAAALRMLAADRFDAVALQPDEALAAMRADPALAARLERLNPPIAQQPYFLVASPQFAARQAALLERLWQSSQVLRQALEAP